MFLHLLLPQDHRLVTIHPGETQSQEGQVLKARGALGSSGYQCHKEGGARVVT